MFCDTIIKLEILKSLRGFYDGLASPPPSPTVIRLNVSFSPCPFESPAILVDAQNIVQMRSKRPEISPVAYRNVGVGCTKTG